MIDTELIKEVLGYDNEATIIRIVKNYRDIKYDVLSPINGHYTETINIYELAHKCKEWASNYGKGNPSKYPFYIWTGIDHNGWWNAFATEFNSFCEFTPCVEQNVLLPCIFEKTEPEAIFKACQWILDNKDK